MPNSEGQEKPAGLLSFNELMSLSLAFNTRVDLLWQRMLYAHAAIVGVMVFFGTSSDPFYVPRVLVFFFYSINIAITIAAFLESYAGLSAALEDLKKFPKSSTNSHVQTWVLNRRYHRHARTRIISLGIVWLVLGYLLVYPAVAFVLF